MLKIDNIQDLIKLVLGVTDDDLYTYIGGIKAYQFFVSGGCYELAKIVKYYFKDAEYVLRNDGEHVAILYNNEIYDAYDGLDADEILSENIPEKVFIKNLEDFNIVSEEELNKMNFGNWSGQPLINGRLASETLLEELKYVGGVEICPPDKTK